MYLLSTGVLCTRGLALRGASRFAMFVGMNALVPYISRLEVGSSVALDAGGTTTALTAYRPRRERQGFGCPFCGEPVNLEASGVLHSLAGGHGLPCCGYVVDGLDAVRLLRAARLLRAGASAH